MVMNVVMYCCDWLEISDCKINKNNIVNLRLMVIEN